jgi:predicted CXXCH cytochrome family protein
MPSEFRSPRTLSNWIELDYFRRRRLPGWRAGMAAALLGSIACLAGLVWARGYRTFQAGPLSAPHALFNNDCHLCHQSNGATLTRLVWGEKVGSVPDGACRKCHEGAKHNPPHAEMGRCTSCHKEHRGHAALVRLDDRQCTKCHADLQRDGGSPPGAPYGGQEGYARSVTAFTAGEHPPFRRWSGGKEKDSGTLKFDHAVHLAEQGVMTIDAKQWAKLREDLRKKGADPDDAKRPWKLRKLECSDCHQMDAAGRYMAPLSFEKHCQECHPLGVQVVGPWKDAKLQEEVWKFGRTPIRHPARSDNPDTVWASLRERLTRFIGEPRHERFLDVEKDPPGGIDRPPSSEVERRKEKEFAWVDRYVRRTGEVLFNGQGGCRYCHTIGKAADVATLTAPVLERTAVPARWWDHAVFRHDAHRMLRCTECHDAKNSKKASDVLLPGIDTCLKCHDAKAQVQARHDCVECHVYHDPKGRRAAREKGRLRIDLSEAE